MRRAVGLSLLGFVGLSLLTLISVVYMFARLAPDMPPPRPSSLTLSGDWELPDSAPHASLTHRTASLSLAKSSKVSSATREQRLRERMDGLLDLSPVPEVVVDQSQGVTVVKAHGQVLATVLPEDLPDYASSLDATARKQVEAALADRWRQKLQLELDLNAYMSQPGFRRFALAFAGWTFLLALCLHLLVRYLSRHVLHSPAWSLKLAIWLTWLFAVLALVPEARDLSQLVRHGMLKPLYELMLVGVGSGVALLLGRTLLHRYVESVRVTSTTSDIRFETRLATAEAAGVFGLQLAVAVAAAGAFLVGMGVELGAAATGAGVFGAVFGWVAQDTIRDLISGLTIVVEDQFGVGDFISTPVATGTVEEFNLRCTRLRDADGGLFIVPNTDLRRVKNLSSQFSQVDYKVQVAYTADLTVALKALEEEAGALASERSYPTPDVLGVQRLAPEGVTLRVQLRTPPSEQYAVERELNRRVKVRFDQEGVEFARLVIGQRLSG